MRLDRCGRTADVFYALAADVVNTAARLQACAEAGQLVMSARVHDVAGDRWPGATAVQLELKGKTEPMRAYSLRV